MDRYWRELSRAARHEAPAGLQFRSLLRAPPATSSRTGRLSRAWQRYVEYPIRAMTASLASVFHLLDHTHAQLLPHLVKKGRCMVTVHDLIPLRDSRGLTAAQIKRFKRSVMELRRADLVIAVSQFTAGDVQNLLGGDCPPLRVLPMGVDFRRFREKVDGRHFLSVGNGFVCLCVGTALPRKNMQLLPALAALVLKSLPELTILKVGSHFDPETRRQLQKLAPRLTVREIAVANETELIGAYQRADVLFFPSLLEGFGWPVLEAMAAGTPVVASHASSIPEVGGEAALFFDPSDAGAAATQIVKIAEDTLLRESLVQKGLAKAATLDWSLHLARLCEIYRELAGQSPQSLESAAWLSR